MRLPKRWFHCLILFCIIAAGAGMRFYRIGRQSLWLDEYWAVYLATGRGDSELNSTLGEIHDPPPETGFAGDPGWWHVWTGLDAGVHPPLYHVVLRWWIDAFGDGDFATRALSALASLGGIGALYVVLKKSRGPWPALIAAAMMSFASIQLDFSQETRPYTLIALLGILFIGAILAIERGGANRWRILWLGILALLLMLTHYLAAGGLLGGGLYLLIRLRGKDRRNAALALVGAAAFFLLIWGKFLWNSRAAIARANVWLDDWNHGGVPTVLRYLLIAPYRLLLSPKDRYFSLPAALSIALLVFASPLIWRRNRDGLLWSLWMAGSLGMMLVLDALAVDHRAPMLALPRYIFIASPAVYALICSPLPADRRWGWITPVLLLLGAILFGIDRAQLGHDPNIDWRDAAKSIQKQTDAHDVLVFAECNQISPVLNYLGFRHYAPGAQNPVVFLQQPADEKLLGELANRKNVWLIGDGLTPMTLLPGWRIGGGTNVAPEIVMWKVLPSE